MVKYLSLDQFNAEYAGLEISMAAIELVTEHNRSYYADGENAVKIRFANGEGVRIDLAARCCEQLSFDTDDDLGALSGQKLSSVSLDEAHCASEDLESETARDISFLRIHTTDGAVAVISCHNEHSGYYEGFYPIVTEL